MNEYSVVPAAEGAAKPAQNSEKFYKIQPKDPLSLLFTLLFVSFWRTLFSGTVPPPPLASPCSSGTLSCCGS